MRSIVIERTIEDIQSDIDNPEYPAAGHQWIMDVVVLLARVEMLEHCLRIIGIDCDTSDLRVACAELCSNYDDHARELVGFGVMANALQREAERCLEREKIAETRVSELYSQCAKLAGDHMDTMAILGREQRKSTSLAIDNAVLRGRVKELEATNPQLKEHSDETGCNRRSS